MIEISVNESGKVTGGGQVIGYAGEVGCRQISITSYPEFQNATYWLTINDGETVADYEVVNGIYVVSSALLSVSKVLMVTFMSKNGDSTLVFRSEPFKLIVGKSIKIEEAVV